jgi:hypothetical protein
MTDFYLFFIHSWSAAYCRFFEGKEAKLVLMMAWCSNKLHYSVLDLSIYLSVSGEVAQ